MCSIKCILSVYLTGADNFDRRLAAVLCKLFHDTDLHTGSLSSQEDVIAYIECILGISCRMSLRNSQKLKVVLIILNFRTFSDTVSQTEEDITDLVNSIIKRMSCSATLIMSRQSYIDNFLLKLIRTLESLHLSLALSEYFFHLCTDFIYHLTCFRSFLRCEIAHAAKYAGKLTLLTEILNSYLLDISKILYLFNLFFKFFAGLIQTVPKIAHKTSLLENSL